MSDKCYFCESERNLVRVSCVRADNGELLDSECVCAHCFQDDVPLHELFGIGVLRTDEDGTHSVGGKPDSYGP